MRKHHLIVLCLLALLAPQDAQPAVGADPGGDASTGAIRLIVQGDDMGAAQAANDAFQGDSPVDEPCE